MGHAQGKLSVQLLLTFLTVAGGRAMQVYTSANYARALVRPRQALAGAHEPILLWQP